MSSIGNIGLHAHEIRATPEVEPATGRGTIWIWIATLLILAAAFAVPYTRILPRSTRDLKISASDSNGQMILTWDRESPEILDAQSGRLEVVDGANTATYPVEESVLRSGSLRYFRHSDDLLLTLVLLREGRETHREAMRSIGPVHPSAPATAERFRRR